MLDQMSGGRLELGVGRGPADRIGDLRVQSIEESREKYRDTPDWLFRFPDDGPPSR
jgi:alkanesulfonate monooxygenase SsuD/methylene tetrahydromethanopterin reductase-like flavin-dependent oxidoreductase (luciferase family)